jgi:hypothetical protein
MNDNHNAESLAYYLERADYHANQLGLTRVVARLRRLRQIAPEVPERVPEPESEAPVTPGTSRSPDLSDPQWRAHPIRLTRFERS